MNGLDLLPPELVEAVARFLISRKDILSFGRTSRRNYACSKEPLLRFPGALDKAFNWAVENGSITLLREALQRRSTYANKGRLRMACKHGHVAIFDELISQPDFRKVLEEFFELDSFNEGHILYVAAHHSHLDLVKRIIALPEIDVARIHAAGHATPLIATLKKAHSLEVMDVLVEAGADIKAHRPHGEQVLVEGAIRDNVLLLAKLFEMGADQAMDMEDWDRTMLELSFRNKTETMLFFIHRRPDIMATTDVAHAVLRTSHGVMIQKFLDNGVDWTNPPFDEAVPAFLNNNRYLSHWSWYLEQLTVVKQIVEAGAPVVPDRGGETPLSRSVLVQDEKTFPFFLEHAKASGMADPQILGKLLHLSRNPVITRALVDAGADVNALDDVGRPPLLTVMQYLHPEDDIYNNWGAEHKFMESAAVLLHAGADPNFISPAGTTTLQVALRRPVSVHYLRMLVQMGARVPNPAPEPIKSRYPLCYLHMLSDEDKPEVARLLVNEAGGNVKELPLEPRRLSDTTSLWSVTQEEYMKLLEE